MLQVKVNRGSALLTALFIMTMVAIVATAMTTRLQLDIYRTRLIVIHDKLYLASQAVTFWTFAQLNDAKNHFNKANEQGLVAVYPREMENIYNTVQIAGGVYDLQSKFNLNNVSDKAYASVFANLLKNTLPQSNGKTNDNIVLAVQDWISAYDLAKGKDLYTDYYLSQTPPYFPSHQLMQSSSELRLIKDISADLFLALEPYVTVLPETMPININTASKPLIMSLGNGLSEAHATELIQARGENGIEDMKDISELLKKIALPGEQITNTSTYFLSVAYVKSDEFQLVVYTLFQRSIDKDKKLIVNIVRESINSF